MKTLKSKLFATIAVILMLSTPALLASTLTVNAQTAGSPSYCFIAINPSPIGIGQTTLVDFWMADVTAGSIGATGNFYSGVTVTITAPDGTQSTRGPFTLNSLATGFFDYTPTAIGTYTFQMIYPGQTFASIGTTYAGCKSTPETLVVQSQSIGYYQQTPLPNYYWTRPINAMNYAWSAVSGNWLMAAWNESSSNRAFDDGSSYVGEGVSPNSAHILWTSPLSPGGLVGGQYGQAEYYTGASYEQFFEPPVIMNDIIYYQTILANEPSSETNYPSITAVSLTTGETLFTINNETFSFGQIYTYVSPNQAGDFNYLWSVSGSTWKMYDAGTGKWILTLVNVPSGVTIPSSDGSILVYSLTANAGGYALSLWNSSQAIAQDNSHAPFEFNDYWEWRPFDWQTGPSLGIVNSTGTTLDSSGVNQNTNGTMWTVEETNPIPATAAGQSLSLSPLFNQGGMFDGNDIVAAAIPGGIMNAFFGITWNITSSTPVYIAAYNMKTGAQDYASVLQPPTGLPNDFGATIEETNLYNGHYYLFIKQTLQWAMWNCRTGGQPVWISQPYTNAWGTYAQSGGELEANGLFYAAGWDGEIHAYSVANGNQVFDFHAANAGFNTPYGVYPFYGGITVTADGKLIAQTAQHGNGVLAMYQGQALYVINATSGQSLWNMTGWWNYGALADGVWVVQNNYDNQIYAFGQGATATTVESTLTAITQGQSVVIQGTVTDQSPGAKGTPAISDKSMTAWMAYLYEQQSLSTHPTGVQVHLTAIDPNGNTEDLGYVTSDASGLFSYMFQPPVPGKYTIVATFAGSNSYYGSSAETTIGVVAAAAASAVPVVTPTVPPTSAPTTVPTIAPTPTPTIAATPSPVVVPPGSGIPVATYIAITAVIIIIVAVAAALILRRRK